MLKKLSLLPMFLLLTACVGQWSQIKQDSLVHKNDRYQMTLPVEWMKIQVDDALLVTKDGLRIQRMSIMAKDHKNAFSHIKKSSSVDLLPSELADRFIADFKKENEDDLPSFKVISNQLCQVDGQKGFALQYVFKNADGLLYQGETQGFVTDKGFYAITYLAPKQFFYARDYAVYQQALAKFEVKS